MEPIDPAGLTLDPLTDDLRIWQRRRGHRSATDDFLAAHCASSARPDARRVLDLGSGHGTVTLLLSRVLPDAVFRLVEVQEVSAELARRNLEENRLAARATVECRDLRDLGPGPRYDLVTGTPPFMPKGSGVLPRDPQRAAARFELRGGVEAYLACAARSLEPGGRVSMLMDGAQDVRVRRAFRDAGLRLLSVLVVRPRADRRPRFRGYVGEPAIGPGEQSPVVETSLVVRDETGAYTATMQTVRARFGAHRSAS